MHGAGTQPVGPGPSAAEVPAPKARKPPPWLWASSALGWGPGFRTGKPNPQEGPKYKRTNAADHRQLTANKAQQTLVGASQTGYVEHRNDAYLYIDGTLALKTLYPQCQT